MNRHELITSPDTLKTALKADPKGANEKLDGTTQDRHFFLSSARPWEGTTHEKFAKSLLNIDPHSSNGIRAFAAASRMPHFAQASQCKPDDKMAHEGKRLVKIWQDRYTRSRSAHIPLASPAPAEARVCIATQQT